MGGQQWTNSSSGYVVDCSEGKFNAHHASPLDQYLMGLVDGSVVPPIRAYGVDITGDPCGRVVTNVAFTVSMTNIQALNGIRSPGPATAQRDFRMCFVVESNGRLLNPTEMTFYEILGEYIMRPVPAGAPDPYVADNWVSISKFFGGGTTWSNNVLSLIRPTISSVHRSQDGRVQISGTGYPGRQYSLQAASNMVAWKTLTNKTASSNGQYTFDDNTSTQAVRRFYRLSNP
jgi:hypothetical protein